MELGSHRVTPRPSIVRKYFGPVINNEGGSKEAWCGSSYSAGLILEEKIVSVIKLDCHLGKTREMERMHLIAPTSVQ